MTVTDTNSHNLQKVIDKLLDDVHNGDPDSDTYWRQVQAIEALVKSKETNAKAKVATRFISGDALASVCASLVGIGMIVGHERASVITSQAMKFVRMFK